MKYYFIYIAKPKNKVVDSICDLLVNRKTYKSYEIHRAFNQKNVTQVFNILKKASIKDFVNVVVYDFENSALAAMKRLPERSINMLTIADPIDRWLKKRIPASVTNATLYVPRQKLDEVKLTCDPIKTNLRTISVKAYTDLSERPEVLKQQTIIIDKLLKV